VLNAVINCLLYRAMHSAVVKMTAPQAAKQWVTYVSDTMQLLVLYELDATVAGPLLTAHITHMLAWLLCLYYFNANGTATAAVQQPYTPNRQLAALRQVMTESPCNHNNRLFDVCHGPHACRAYPVPAANCLGRVIGVPDHNSPCWHVGGSLLYVLAVAFELHNINLLTRQQEVPPPGHWQAAFAAGELTEQQRQQMAIATQYVAPRLEELQKEQQQLMQQLAELQSSVAPSVADAALTAHVKQSRTPSYTDSSSYGSLQDLPSDSQAAPAATAAEAGCSNAAAAAAVSSLVTGAARVAQGAEGYANGHHAYRGSNRVRQQELARASELTQKIAANCRAWRVVASLRGHYSACLLTPLQLAKIMTAAAPYLLIGAPM